MKKMIWLFFLLVVNTGWCVDLSKLAQEYIEIKCSIEPIHRARPKGVVDDAYPLLKLQEGTSLNWSGYAAATKISKPAKNSVSSVSGSWVVPALTSSFHDTYSSIWVGIDGYASETVEQIGTGHDWVTGGQHNYAWFEMFPREAYLINDFPVDIGDIISAEVKYIEKDIFKLSLFNLTKQVFTVIPSRYTKVKNAKRSSAEWVVEAPSDGVDVLPLANFVTALFMDCVATINGKTGSISDSHWEFDKIVMKWENDIVRAVPSSLKDKGMKFSVSWESQ